jgi:DNA-directed RNA polymerase subunit L
MELTILEKKKNRIVFELPGSDHTFCNALKTELWNDEDVKVSTYAIKHPLLAVPKFIVETKSKEATQVLLDANGRLQKQVKAFAKAFEKM